MLWGLKTHVSQVVVVAVVVINFSQHFFYPRPNERIQKCIDDLDL
jgi:hypothetical protein